MDESHLKNLPALLDTEGHHVNAHGGAILFHEGVYYWYGESRGVRQPGDTRRWIPMPGVAVYTSTDLKTWKNRGLAFAAVEDETSDVKLGCTIERPKVVYNAKTGNFVMWFHLELAGKGYAAARTALAIADKPEGPFTFVKSLRPNRGIWPIDLPESLRTPLTRDEASAIDKADHRKAMAEGALARRDFESGQMSRDMTVYVDDDAKAYLVSASEENFTLAIHELTDDYTDFTGKWTRVTPGGHNEAPAIIKVDGKYHMLASGCTGWAPNPARVLVANNIWGPWKNVGNPCVGTNPANGVGPERTFGGQSTWIMPDPEKPGQFIAMFDIWSPRGLARSGHLWLPLKIENGRMLIKFPEQQTAEAAKTPATP